jgi:hypothetical protein
MSLKLVVALSLVVSPLWLLVLVSASVAVKPCVIIHTSYYSLLTWHSSSSSLGIGHVGKSCFSTGHQSHDAVRNICILEIK